MNKRTLLAGVLGAVAMYVWTSLAHMVLPLGQAGIKQIDNEQALLTAMQTAIPSQGMYMFPNMPAGGDQAAYLTKISNGPSGLVVYFPKRDFSFPKLLGVEFGTELAEALIAVMLLSFTGLSTFGGRLGFYVLLGLLAALMTNVSYWNWYGFPSAYTLSYMFTQWVGYICAGLVAAGMKVGSATAR